MLRLLSLLTVVTASFFLPREQSEGVVKVPPGFRATQLYTVPKAQGSWVSLATVDRGRLVACNQYGKLYRITLGEKVTVEELKTPVGKAQGLLFAFGSLYVMGRKGKESGLFRLTDSTGDDQFDRVEHLLRMPVGGEHDAHAILLAPDGGSLYICAGNMTRMPKPGFTSTRMRPTWRGDHLLPRMPDARGHNTGAMPLGGWIARVSPDGAERELIASGFRNEYDIAFAADGELFTFDSDMEWDIGTPWYRPTRIHHVVSGAEFGWRYGTGKWPAYFADSLGSVVDIGPGSPTGVVFGTGAKFPARYQRAMFAGDWSYGVIYAVHLQPDGASFVGTKEAFATASPLAVTDMVVRQEDGALYFLLGGRGSRSSLHKVDYVGTESTKAAPAVEMSPEVRALHRTRRELEALHGTAAEGAVDRAWPYLAHPDRHLRFAARVAIENQPVAQWQERALAEKHDRAFVHGAIALARCGDPGLQSKLLKRLVAVQWDGQPVAERLELLRAIGLVFARLAPTEVDEDQAAIRAKVAASFAGRFPDADGQINRELCRLLAFLGEPSVVATALDLQAAAPSQEEQLHFAYCLRVVPGGWTTELRRRYFQWFEQAAGYRGGSSFRGFCNNVRADAIQRLSESERLALGDLVAKAPKQRPVAPTEARPFVKSWTQKELEPLLAKKTEGHDFARGRKLFGAVACVRCHRFGGEGGAVGPDLSALGGRFGIAEILEAIIEPSKVISDQYQPTVFELKNGDLVVGYVANLNAQTIKVVEDMMKPGDMKALKVDEIVSQTPSPVSMMPAGLLSTLTLAEVQDLVAYLRSGGDPRHPLFK